MGTGIGKDCKICEEQLNFDIGFNQEKTLCNKCKELIPKVLNYLAEMEERWR